MLCEKFVFKKNFVIIKKKYHLYIKIKKIYNKKFLCKQN